MSAIGRVAVLITSEDLDADGALPIVLSGLESADIQTIVYDRAVAGAKSNIADDAAEIIKSSKARIVMGCGDAATLGIARAAAMLSSTTRKTFDFFDADQARYFSELPILPYIEIPTRNWNPAAFIDSSFLIDSRTRRMRRLDTGVSVDSILMSSMISNALTDKQLSYDLLSNLLIAIEGLHQPAPMLSVPLLSSVFTRTVTMIQEFADSYDRIDSRDIQIIGIDASFGACSTPLGPGTALSWAIYGRVETEIQWVAGAILPATVRVLVDRNPEFSATIANLLRVSNEDQDDDLSNEVIETRIRTLLGMVEVPIRLRDLDIKKSDLQGVVETASSVSNHSAELLNAVISKSL